MGGSQIFFVQKERIAIEQTVRHNLPEDHVQCLR